MNFKRTLLLFALPAALLVACDAPSSSTAQTSGQAETVTVTFTSDPTGSTLFVDGKRIGTTPVSVELTTGRTTSYRVEPEEPNEDYTLYHPYSGSLTADKDTAIEVWVTRTSAEEQAQQQAVYQERVKRQEQQRLEDTLRSSRWRLNRSRDEITDQDDSYLVLAPVQHSASRIYDPRFYVVCAPDWSYGIKPYISTDEYIGDQDGRVYVDYRFDSGAPHERVPWLNSNTGTAAFVPSQSRSQFFNRMQSAESMTIRVYDYRNRPNTYEFDLKGTKEALTLLGCYSGPIG